MIDEGYFSQFTMSDQCVSFHHHTNNNTSTTIGLAATTAATIDSEFRRMNHRQRRHRLWCHHHYPYPQNPIADGDLVVFRRRKSKNDGDNPIAEVLALGGGRFGDGKLGSDLGERGKTERKVGRGWHWKIKEKEYQGRILPPTHPQCVRVQSILRDIVQGMLTGLLIKMTAMFQGMLDFCNSDAEIATFLGHEVGHGVAWHESEYFVTCVLLWPFYYVQILPMIAELVYKYTLRRYTRSPN
ncbi:uncharacterized protein LOC132276641 isoform X1 [Cornus florida]|uniref:uncharacterized protein LOC132276641 isoform X1 n=1 Tax=Cornus florida TaxID=4283 RepID=UPI00289E21A8|nr:uncharacterized protein LOC132276641 isoform X1 [Cornus florida]